MLVRIDQLKEGDAVDLYGDKFADPHRDPAKAFEFEYVPVAYVRPETPSCIAVGFEGFDEVGFPPGHVVDIMDRTAQPAPSED